MIFPCLVTKWTLWFRAVYKSANVSCFFETNITILEKNYNKEITSMISRTRRENKLVWNITVKSKSTTLDNKVIFNHILGAANSRINCTFAVTRIQLIFITWKICPKLLQQFEL